jgi:hypothetical protein
MSQKLSQEIDTFLQNQTDSSSLGEFLKALEHKGFGFFLIVLSLPAALPVPAPGYASPFALVLIYFAFSLFKGNEYPQLPPRIMRQPLKLQRNSKLGRSMIRFLAFFEKFLRPRLGFLFHTNGIYKVLAICILLASISMLSPLPLTNTAPAMSIFLLGLSLLEKDGLFVILGVLSMLLGVGFSLVLHIALIYFGWEAVDIIQDTIYSWLGR